MSEADAATPTSRRKISEALKNGPGTVISRLIIMAMPFMFTAAVWIGDQALSLVAEKFTSAFERLDKRLDKIEGGLEAGREFDRRIELRVQHTEDEVVNLKDRRK